MIDFGRQPEDLAEFDRARRAGGSQRAGQFRTTSIRVGWYRRSSSSAKPGLTVTTARHRRPVEPPATQDPPRQPGKPGSAAGLEEQLVAVVDDPGPAIQTRCDRFQACQIVGVPGIHGPRGGDHAPSPPCDRGPVSPEPPAARRDQAEPGSAACVERTRIARADGIAAWLMHQHANGGRETLDRRRGGLRDRRP